MRYGTLLETRVVAIRADAAETVHVRPAGAPEAARGARLVPALTVTVPKTAGGWRPAPGEPVVLDDGTRAYPGHGNPELERLVRRLTLAYLHTEGLTADPEWGRAGA